MCAAMIRSRVRPPYQPPMVCKHCAGVAPQFWRVKELFTHLRGMHNFTRLLPTELVYYEAYQGSCCDILPEEPESPKEDPVARQMPVLLSLERAIAAGKSVVIQFDMV